MESVSALCIIVLLPYWIRCQSSLFTKLVEDNSLDISQCTNTNLVFSQMPRTLVSCSRLCAADDQCTAMIYMSADMSCTGCGSLGSIGGGVPDPGNFIISSSAGTKVYSKVPRNCESGWLQLHDMCYWIGNDVMTFAQSALKCGQKDSHVVHIDTAEENVFIKDAALDAVDPSVKKCTFIGITDEIVEGTWIFYDTNDTIIFIDFQGVEPNNGGAGEHCAAFHTGFTYWVDYPCGDPCLPICEKNL